MRVEVHAGLTPVTTIERHVFGRVQNHSPELYRVHAYLLPRYPQLASCI